MKFEKGFTIFKCSNIEDSDLIFFTSYILRLIYKEQKDLRQIIGKPVQLFHFVFDEAHKYIIENKDQQNIISLKIFEKIAKEGRKFGIFMILASQRPSELSKTVLSQCNNFILHRIRNNVDIDQMRRSIPYITDSQLIRIAYLKTGSALFVGEAFSIPMDHQPTLIGEIAAQLSQNNDVEGLKELQDMQGGFEVLYEVQPLEDGEEITQDILADTTDALMSRINVLGVSEPVITIEGDNRVRVQLAGVEDQATARELLSTEANLTFRNVEDEVMLTGNDLKQGEAAANFDENGQPIVILELNDSGKFAEITSEISQMPPPSNVLVIWLDFEEGVDSYAAEMAKPNQKFVSAPSVSQRFNSPSVEISGAFTVEETQNLAGILNAGALPVSLTEIYSTSVGNRLVEWKRI
ncbi:hypothetical protein [Streptomyces sp. NPDC046876]|uniref:SecDF P1 head subdomain-containing protein n=1 Tax=Streptomyces sp. NPDC046876 TaxID=3155616 RepID=UPI0033E12A56